MLTNSAQPGSVSPEVSNLITSVHVLVNMLKMPRVYPTDTGLRLNDFKNRYLITIFDPIKDIDSTSKPINAHISDIEKSIESIVNRNDVVDKEILSMKTDIGALSEKFLTSKVSSCLLYTSDAADE